MKVELPVSLPRDEWIKTECEHCGAINETYWDKDGFPMVTKRRCMCVMIHRNILNRDTEDILRKGV